MEPRWPQALAMIAATSFERQSAENALALGSGPESERADRAVCRLDGQPPHRSEILPEADLAPDEIIDRFGKPLLRQFVEKPGTAAAMIERHHQAALLRCSAPAVELETEGPVPAASAAALLPDTGEGGIPDQGAIGEDPERRPWAAAPPDLRQSFAALHSRSSADQGLAPRSFVRRAPPAQVSGPRAAGSCEGWLHGVARRCITEWIWRQSLLARRLQWQWMLAVFGEHLLRFCTAQRQAGWCMATSITPGLVRINRFSSPLEAELETPPRTRIPNGGVSPFTFSLPEMSARGLPIPPQG